MPDFHIVEARPSADWVYSALHRLSAAVSEEVLGEDQSAPEDWLRSAHSDERTTRKGILLALPGPAPDGPRGRFGLPAAPTEPADILGSLEFGLPLLDNLHLVDDGYCQVRADVRRRGIGSHLWAETVRIAGEQGRDTLIGWSEHLIADELEHIPSPAGAGQVPRDGATRFAQHLGLRLAQVERQSRLELPVDPDLLAQLRRSAEAHALPGYRVESWEGPTPEEHLDRVAALNAVMSTDAPVGEVDWQPEAWDAERVRHSEERILRTGRSVRSLAIHNATGEPAGLSAIYLHQAYPHRPEQWVTAVAGPHRGHRLGLLIKVANLELLARVEPAARHLDTWNAGENGYMLAINEQLGFHPHSVHGAWQLKL